MSLENVLLRSKIFNSLNPKNPAMPSASDNLSIAGQGDSAGLVNDKPLERINSARSSAFSEPAPVTDVGWSRTATGGVALIPSLDVKQRIEDQFVPETMWSIRNQLLPAVQGIMRGSPTSARPPIEFMRYGDNSWRWNNQHQQWESYFSPEKDAMCKRFREMERKRQQ